MDFIDCTLLDMFILQFSCLDPSPTTASIKQNKNERFPHTFASRALTVNWKVCEPNWHGTTNRTALQPCCTNDYCRSCRTSKSSNLLLWTVGNAFLR